MFLSNSSSLFLESSVIKQCYHTLSYCRSPPSPGPDAVLSRPGPVTDEILRIVKYCASVSILTGAASPAITVKVERPSETHRPLCIVNLLT